MRVMRGIFVAVVGALALGSTTSAQVVINEYVDDQRTGTAGQTPDTREFVELYNTTGAPIDISGWKITTIQLGGNFGLAAGTKTYTVPGGQTIPANGYYVVGAGAVPNVNFVLSSGGFGTSGTNFFPDGADLTNGQHVLELRNGANALIDALGSDIFRGTERANMTAEQLAEVGGVGGGWWAQDPSFDENSVNNSVFSLSRYRNGLDKNINGRDFGMLPITPGTSNETGIPSNFAHTIPNVDALGLEQEVTQYYASFIMPRAIDPTNADGNFINPQPIAASPQGGKAIIAYDESGGGNAIYSRELVHKFDLWAYIDPAPLGTTTNATTDAQDSEATVYGLGTTDGLFGTPNGAGLLTATSTQNGSTGVGWMIQRVENFNNGSPTNQTVLQLVDFGDGGDSLPADHEWEVMKSYDITTAGWVRLSIEHDELTGVITAKKDADTIVYSVPGDYNNNNVVDAADYVLFRQGGTLQNEPETPGSVSPEDLEAWKAHFGQTTHTGIMGNFYVGYRENTDGIGTANRPPTFDMIAPGIGLGANVPEPGSIVLLALGMMGLVARRVRR